jgi:hypothetical protein
MSPRWTNGEATRGGPGQSGRALCWGRRGRPWRASDGWDRAARRGATGLVWRRVDRSGQFGSGLEGGPGIKLETLGVVIRRLSMHGIYCVD